MNVCSWKPGKAVLHDGREVETNSEEWRHECEAKTIINMENLTDRRLYLYGRRDDVTGRMTGGIRNQRGEQAVKRLEQTIKSIWYGSGRR